MSQGFTLPPATLAVAGFLAGGLLAIFLSACWLHGLLLFVFCFASFLYCSVCWLAGFWMLVFMSCCCLATAVGQLRIALRLEVLIGLMACWLVGFSLSLWCYTKFPCWLSGFWLPDGMDAGSQRIFPEVENGSHVLVPKAAIRETWSPHFGTPATVWVPRRHPGRPWEQQEGQVGSVVYI